MPASAGGRAGRRRERWVSAPAISQSGTDPEPASGSQCAPDDVERSQHSDILA
jgi:hypothetical protein